MLIALYLRILAGACLFVAGTLAGVTHERASRGRRLMRGVRQ